MLSWIKNISNQSSIIYLTNWNVATCVELCVGDLQDDVITVRGFRPAKEVHLLAGDENVKAVLASQTQLLKCDESVHKQTYQKESRVYIPIKFTQKKIINILLLFQ